MSTPSPLRSARLEVGLSAEAAAKKARIGREYLLKLERGEHSLTETMARRLARIYGGIRIDQFYVRSKESVPSSGLGTRPTRQANFATARNA